ncbi:rhodanese-like domain-containing protein [Sphaerotilus sp.]|jgi:rhodanese-related sulfurtransferase|uniref:rhodanese-like domain-containing protein n=1 Tax=Sphaerotilus sp. TaxID=2093942 RepID=UPI0025E1F2AD|nr:rhodanese-like domain-containing protein [Sphaerotilus sp.]
MQQLRVDAVAAQVQAWTAQGQHPVLLDVREPWEIATARIVLEGAASVTIPMQQIPARWAEIDRDQPILALCHHGVRSQQVALFLAQQGYTSVYNVAGGIDAWSRLVDARVPMY